LHDHDRRITGYNFAQTRLVGLSDFMNFTFVHCKKKNKKTNKQTTKKTLDIETFLQSKYLLL